MAHISAFVVFPAVVLTLGITTSAYFFMEWLRYKKTPHFLLLWAIGLFLMYWFQVPIILTNLGHRTVTLTDFNLFFSLTFPITFFALVCVYLGVINVVGLRLLRPAIIILYLWIIGAFIFFSYFFILNHGIIKNYTLPLGGNILLFIPMYILIILALVRWYAKPILPRSVHALFGALAIIGAVAAGIFRNFIIIQKVLIYPPQFWYLVLTGEKRFFVLQTLSILLFSAGFFLLYRAFINWRTVSQNNLTA